MKPTVAIIGAGFSGIAVAIRMRTYVRVPLDIYLIDCSEFSGRGLAYANSDSLLTMNGMAGRLSAFEGAPDHFVEWLRQKGPGDVSLETIERLRSYYAPRKLYGEYLKEILARFCGPSAFGVSIHLLNDQVVDVHATEQRFSVELASGTSYLVDGVVLATGNARPRNILNLPSPECIEDPWNVNAISSIPRQADVLVIGTGQTMMDVIVLLRSLGHQGKICAVSRRGLVAHPHAPRETEYPLDLDALPRRLNPLVSYIRRAALAWAAQGGDWRAVMNSLRPHTQRIWIEFSLREKLRFLEHVAPYWRIHRTRVPPKVWQTVQAAILSGQLRCLAGRVALIERATDSFSITVHERGSSIRSTFDVARIVNCTGPDQEIGNSQAPLMRRLAESGLITCHPVGVGLHVGANGAVIDRKGAISNRIFAVGPLCEGSLLEITVIREIRKQAAEVAAEISRTLCWGAESISTVPDGQIGY